MTFKLDEFLPYLASVAAAALSQRFAARYQAEAGLSVPEWRILAHLSDQSPASVRDITRKVNLEKSVVSRAAVRLEQRGLISRAAHTGDQRLIALEPTPEGHALMDKLGRIANAFQAELAAELGGDVAEAQRILRILAR